MSQKRFEWPWWTAAAAFAVSLAICASVWFGIFNLAGVGARFAEAKGMEGQWSRALAFDAIRPLTTGRSVSVKRTD